MNANAALGRAAATFAAVVAGFVAVLLQADPAGAHAVLRQTIPVRDAVLGTPPAEVVLRFSEPVMAVPGKIRVIGPDGTRADRGDPAVRGRVVTVALRTDAPTGTYVVSYRVLSADSHPVSGAFTYAVGAPSATTPEPAGEATTDPVVRVLIPLTKFVGYAGLVLLVGPAALLAVLWPRRLSRRAPTRLVWTGLGLTGLATLAGLVLQAPYATGAPLTGITVADLRDVLGGAFGTVHVVRLGVLAAAATLLHPLLAGRAGTPDRVVLTALGVVGVTTWPLAGHAAASSVPIASVLADAVHLTAMAVWLGGLLVLVTSLLRSANRPELDEILPTWSRWAALAMSALLLAGTIQALVEVGSPAALVTTTYGWLVIAKVTLVAGVIAVAAFSRRLVRARVAPEQPGRLRRLVGVEVAIAGVAVAVAAVLVQTTPARSAPGNRAAAAPPYSITVAGTLYRLQLGIDPARPGTNAVHLFAHTPDGAGTPVRVVEWRATAALPSSGIEPIQIPLQRITDNQSIGDVELPTAGAWEFRFTLRVSEIDQATVTATVPIG